MHLTHAGVHRACQEYDVGYHIGSTHQSRRPGSASCSFAGSLVQGAGQICESSRSIFSKETWQLLLDEQSEAIKASGLIRANPQL